MSYLSEKKRIIFIFRINDHKDTQRVTMMKTSWNHYEQEKMISKIFLVLNCSSAFFVIKIKFLTRRFR